MRVVNAVVRRILMSPLHDLLSRFVVLLVITGRRSGRAYTIPVRYAENGDVLTVVSRRGRTWWWNLEGGAALTVVLRGRSHPAHGSATTDPAAVRAALTELGQPVVRSLAEGVAISMVVGPADPRVTPTGRWGRWFRAVTLGELAGFAVPAVVAAFLAGSGSPLLQALALIAAGAVEGLVLGLAQAYALRTVLSWVPTLAWAGATSCGAAIAWAAGAVPATVGDRVALGVAGLCAMGVLQWRVLAVRSPGSAWWIAATAGAWALALGVFAAVATPLWHEGQPVWLIALIGLLGGAAMAVTVAALTGLAFVRLVAGSEREHQARAHAA